MFGGSSTEESSMVWFTTPYVFGYSAIMFLLKMIPCLSIVNRGKWLGRPVNITEADKQAKIYVGRPLTLHIFCIVLITFQLFHVKIQEVLYMDDNRKSKRTLLSADSCDLSAVKTTPWWEAAN